MASTSTKSHKTKGNNQKQNKPEGQISAATAAREWDNLREEKDHKKRRRREEKVMIAISQCSLCAHAQNPFCIDTTQIPRIKGTDTPKEKENSAPLDQIRSDLLLHRHRQIAELCVPEFPESKLRAIRFPSLLPLPNCGSSCTRDPKPLINVIYLLVSSFIMGLLASSLIICYQPLKDQKRSKFCPKFAYYPFIVDSSFFIH